MWCSVFARFCHLCWQAGAHGWNVNESWPGTWWFPVSSTQHAFGCGVGKKRGTAVGCGSMAHCWALKQQAPCSGMCWHFGVGRVGVGFVCFGSRAWPMPHMFASSFVGVCVVVGVTGLLFGNCIVDASILQGQHHWCCVCESNYLRIPSILWVLVVLSIKCSCGTTFLWSSFQGRMVDALASGAEEGRGNLR